MHRSGLKSVRLRNSAPPLFLLVNRLCLSPRPDSTRFHEYDPVAKNSASGFARSVSELQEKQRPSATPRSRPSELRASVQVPQFRQMYGLERLRQTASK